MGSPRSAPKSKEKPADGVVKHRACDECRSRKLACTKEPNGCSRCVRESLRCVYSPQKQMGRPRKRRAAESQDGHAALNDIALDTSLEFLDAESSNLEFLDLLSPSYALPTLEDAETAVQEARFPPGHFPFGANIIGRIDFADCDSTDDEFGNDLTSGLAPYMLSQPRSGPSSYCPSPENTPESSPSPRPYHNIQCRCLSSMYLAMEALANLPPHALQAMVVARNACKAASEVVHCASCSLPLLEDPRLPPPVQAFQNMMLLGGLIPTIANAYARIVELIDAEAALARSGNHMLSISFLEAGGLLDSDQTLDADSWRHTVRSLLRIDVYGMSFSGTFGSPRVSQFHLSLKDVIDALETRSRVRHAKVDQMVASGQFRPDMHSHLLPAPHMPEPLQKPNCFTIIELARGALDRLVIA